MGQGVFAQGVSAQGKGLSWGGVYQPLPKTATEAGGTHPTGMHSCLRAISFAPCSDRVSLVPLGVISINLSYTVLRLVHMERQQLRQWCRYQLDSIVTN